MSFKKESVGPGDESFVKLLRGTYVIGQPQPSFHLYRSLAQVFKSNIQQVFIKCLVATTGGIKPPERGPGLKGSIFWVLEETEQLTMQLKC